MGEIEIGDTISSFNSDTKVIAIHPQGVKDIYEVEFIDGAKTRVTEEHLWACWVAGNRIKVRTTRDIIDLLLQNKNVLIPMVAVEFEKRNINIDPYILGAMLGDGGLTQHLTFTTADSDILEEINKRLPKYISIRKTKDIQYSLVQDERNKKGCPINYLADEFKKYGLLPIACADRFIPLDYLYNSKEIRLSILRGILDTDGYIDTRGHIDFTSKSIKLAQGVQFLVRSLGGKATLTKVKKGFEGFIGTYYNVYIRLPNNTVPFLLPRKIKRMKSYNGHTKEAGRRIKSITFVGKEKAQCITVADSSNLYLTDDFILTHNSWVASEWLLTNCYFYPGTKWFIAREELARLMKSSYITFLKVCTHHKIPSSDWKLNGQYNYIEFTNGSRIDLLDVAYKPSDPMYERLGSTEYTGGWLEEAGEIDFRAFDILKTRIGRHKNKEYNLLSKMFITCNPNKKWLYREVYKPFKEGTLPQEFCFIQSLYSDNPYTAQEYGQNLAGITDKSTKERLMYGNWEYDDDPSALISYDAILDVFTNPYDPNNNDKYLVCDVARYGRDKTVITLWEGLKCYSIKQYTQQGLDTTREVIRNIAWEEKIPYSRILVDEDGVGSGIIDEMRGIKGFMANRVPLNNNTTHKPDNFPNLKTQCAYLLADYINERKICVIIEDEKIKAELIEELEQIKSKDADKDGKRKIIEKDKVKELIGRSPDLSDCLLMRMWFELNKSGKSTIKNNYKAPQSYFRR